MVLPFLPFGLGYCHENFTNQALARLCLKESRDWFYVWMGALSYTIAFAGQCQKETQNSMYRKFPDWQVTLSQAGLDPAWIDGIQYSSVCNFDPRNTTSRVGCVVDLLDPDSQQPSVDWFVEHGIPVWFRFDSEDQTRFQGPPWKPIPLGVEATELSMLQENIQIPSTLETANGSHSSRYIQQNPRQELPWVAHFQDQS